MNEELLTAMEKAFINSKTNKYAIYQLKDDDHLRQTVAFEPLDRLTKNGFKVDRNNYDLIYMDDLTDADTLDAIYERFNLNHPYGFIGHSLSVSDIVAFNKDGKKTAHYVDSFGFKELPEFYMGELKADKKPVVIIQWSEHPSLPDGQRLTLSNADKMFGDLDRYQRLDREKADYTGSWYYKTKFLIEFVANGEANSYEGKQDFGDGDGGLFEHIQAYADHYLTSENAMRYRASFGAGEADIMEKELLNIRHGMLPLFTLHRELSAMERDLVAVAHGRIIKTKSKAARDKLGEFVTAIQEYTKESRISLNTENKLDLSAFPKPSDYALNANERKLVEHYMKRLDELPLPAWIASAQPASGATGKTDMEM